MKRTISTNSGYYLLSQSPGQYYLLATTDQNICIRCHKFNWICNVIYKRFDKKNFNNLQISLCKKCLKESEYLSKNHHCPFHNVHVNEDGKICEYCFDKLKEKTEELYKKEIMCSNIKLENTYVDI